MVLTCFLETVYSIVTLQQNRFTLDVKDSADQF